MPVPFAASTIIAQAFALVELSPPSSFADDSDQAADATLHYPAAMDLCLEWTDWSFASRMVALPATTPEAGVIADPDLPHSYALPDDCVILREVKIPGVRYRLDDRLLRADQAAPLPVRYTRRLTDEAILPAGFRTAVALQLAVLLAPRWLGVDTKRQSLSSQLDDLRRRTSQADARTASPTPYGETGSADWVTGALR